MEASQPRPHVGGARRLRLTWNIAGAPHQPPDQPLHRSVCALRCLQLPTEAIAAWETLRNDHFEGEPQVLEGAFLHEVTCINELIYT